MSKKAAVKSDSADYEHTFFGILNAQGRFWTPLPFDNERAAKEYLANFVAVDRQRFGDMERTHKVRPVRVKLELIEEDIPNVQ